MIADKMSGVPKDVLQAIRTGQPSAAVVKSFMDAGYQERDLLYIVLAAAVKVMSNYSNQAFGTSLDPQFAAYKVD
jgi:hypothetical protein